MLLRLAKAKEAQSLTAALLKDKSFTKSEYRSIGLYYHGFASYLVNDFPSAGRSLSQLAPFSDPVSGTHTRYLLGCIHLNDGERAEAAAQFEGALTDFAQRRLDAREALKSPDKFKNDPEEKARLELLANGPAPDHIARALFRSGVLAYEDGRFGDAFTRFQTFVKESPKSPLAIDAQLRLGICQVQLKQYKEAMATLRQVADKDARLADQAILWVGKAQVNAADPAAGNYVELLKPGIDSLRKAGERVGQLAARDPEAKVRGAEILMDLGDVQQMARLYRDAVASYQRVLADKQLPEREAETLQRLATALHLAGDYAESDKICDRFIAAYAANPLLPAVLFRRAENAYFRALAAEKIPNADQRDRDVKQWTDEAVKRYEVVVTRFPEFTHANLAKYGIALAYYNKGDLDKAKDQFESIAQPERVGELAAVPYQLADILIRQAPTKINNAVDAGKLEEAMKAAIELLEGFVTAQPKDPRTPDAYLKLGHCYQRSAAVLADPAEKTKVLTTARTTYEKLVQLFPRDSAMPLAVFERAKVLAQIRDPNRGITELRRFQGDGQLMSSPVAPLALVHLATLLRAQNQPLQAVEVMQRCRNQYEAALQKDLRAPTSFPCCNIITALLSKNPGNEPRRERSLSNSSNNRPPPRKLRKRRYVWAKA